LRNKQEPRCIQLLTPVQRTSEIDTVNTMLSVKSQPALDENEKSETAGIAEAGTTRPKLNFAQSLNM